MSENHSSIEQAPFEHQEMLQFSDGLLALAFRTPGDKIDWHFHKYARLENNDNTVIVSTNRGQNFALGKGVAVLLPADKAEANIFGNRGDTVQYIDTVDNQPTNIIIGKPWSYINGETVNQVLLQYSWSNIDYAAADQVSQPNPFHSAIEHIDRVAAIAHPSQ